MSPNKAADGKRELYKEIFNSYDADGNGYLSVRELGKCMKALGDKVSPHDLKFLISCADKDENGKMDVDEFCMMVTVKNLIKMIDLMHLREVFCSFDLNKDGNISVRELGRCMEKLGVPMTEPECRALINAADKDADGCMSFFEFVLMINNEKTLPCDDDECMREAFCMFDKNGDGCIDKTELKDVLKSLDENPTQEELEDMFEEADVDKDGRITFDEFIRILRTD